MEKIIDSLNILEEAVSGISFHKYNNENNLVKDIIKNSYQLLEKLYLYLENNLQGKVNRIAFCGHQEWLVQ